MLAIDRQNYEAFFLDYLDGNLSPSQEKLLLSFLEENPDLKKELEQFEPIVIEKDEIHFADKQGLKKDPVINDLQRTSFEHLCIAYVEGDLNAREKALFEEMADNDQRKSAELEKFMLSKLKADHSIIFPNKNRLKKSALSISRLRSFYPYVAAAASVLVLLALYIFVPQNTDDVYSDRVADIESGKAPITPDVKNEPIIESMSSSERNSKVAGFKSPVEFIQEVKEQSHSDIIMMDEREKEHIHTINPVAIKLESSSSQMRLAHMNIPPNNDLLEKIQDNGLGGDNYFTLKSYLAESVNNSLNKTKENNDQKFGLFNLAQFGVNGINRITGSNMSLEKQYNSSGDAEKIAFNSRLIAFSTPVKEK